LFEKFAFYDPDMEQESEQEPEPEPKPERNRNGNREKVRFRNTDFVKSGIGKIIAINDYSKKNMSYCKSTPKNQM
jgi:hypothetical protein